MSHLVFSSGVTLGILVRTLVIPDFPEHLQDISHLQLLPPDCGEHTPITVMTKNTHPLANAPQRESGIKPETLISVV